MERNGEDLKNPNLNNSKSRFPEKLDPLIKKILIQSGIEQLYPPQEKAIIPSLNRDNIIVSIPTASGKTLIAEITMLQRLLEFRKRGIKRKAVYLCPLKALASEKYIAFS